MSAENENELLTILPNRYLLIGRLKQALFLALRQKAEYALFYLNIDHWQTLLNEYGQHQLELLMARIGQEFTNVLRSEDTVCYIRDGEFAILISHLGSNDVAKTTDVTKIIGKINDIFEQVFYIAEQPQLLSKSIGVVMVGDDFKDADAVIAAAAKRAKKVVEQGGDDFAFNDYRMQQLFDIRNVIVKQLQEALAVEQMRLFFQAMVNDKAEVFGVEALLYWQHPEQGLVGPEQFIPVAEDSGLIEEIGDWAMLNACQQYQQLCQTEEGKTLKYLAINLSTQQFYAEGLYNRVNRAIALSGIAAEQIIFEITEEVLLHDRKRAPMLAMQLHELGVTFAIDDFGVGYASLPVLEHLPFRLFKIDQAYIDNIDKQSTCRIIKTIVAMAEQLEVEVLAKGVETGGQQNRLAELGCCNYQGFWFNKPMLLADMKQFLAAK